MKLKRIILLLSLISLLSAIVVCWFYYSSIKTSTMKDAYYRAEVRVEIIGKYLVSFFSEHDKPARLLAGTIGIADSFRSLSPEIMEKTNQILDDYQEAFNLDAAYLMDLNGKTIASSNRASVDSFEGKDFSFRPYFLKAVGGEATTYLALGKTSGKRGVYSSCPVYSGSDSKPVGVVVLKASIERIEAEKRISAPDVVFVTDPTGLIFISNTPAHLYKTIWKLSPEVSKILSESRQFGTGPWPWAGFVEQAHDRVADRDGNEYLMNSAMIDGFPGWKVIHLTDMKKLANQFLALFMRVTSVLMLIFSMCVGVLVFVLNNMATNELAKRKEAEEALRYSEERYRTIYHNTPAMLHSIDTKGCLVNVSNFWSEWTGYERDEVIGRKLTGFFTEDSRQYAESEIFPLFFESGLIRDIPYQFKKKNGDVIDILTSGYGVRNDDGDVFRSLAISVDVTEANLNRKALEDAKEKLSQHSQELEKQIRKRTGEIASIFEHTPAVIYIKNMDGTYRLVNSEYENLFGVSSLTAAGKKDPQILPEAVAKQFTENDRLMLDQKKAMQFSEQIICNEKLFTYLSTKFPFYGDKGEITGLCSISIDVSELQKAQDTLRNLSAGIMEAQERERASIARELHDELGQVLTVLRMDSVWMEKRFSDVDKKLAERASDMRNLIDKTIQDVRGMAYRLRPVILDDLGLTDALDSLTSEFEKRTGIACFYQAEGVETLDDGSSTAVYRIVQEALTNAARHADADKVEVHLVEIDGNILAQVNDNGAGFDSNMENRAGFGLAGMYERASLAGGKLDITSTKGQGTRVRCWLPLKAKVASV